MRNDELAIVTGARPVFVAVVWMQRGPTSGPDIGIAHTERTVRRGRVASRRCESDQMIVQRSVSPEIARATSATTARELTAGVGRSYGSERERERERL